MSANTDSNEENINWDAVIQQIYEMIGTDTAIVDKYAIILASRIPGFNKGAIISPLIWEVINKREKLCRELQVNNINSIVCETDQGNFVFTAGKFIYFMSKIPSEFDLAKFMPSIARIITTLDKSSQHGIDLRLQRLELEQEFKTLSHEDDKERGEERFPIFKHLISHLAKK
jgi:hypothetical protein